LERNKLSPSRHRRLRMPSQMQIAANGGATQSTIWPVMIGSSKSLFGTEEIRDSCCRVSKYATTSETVGTWAGSNRDSLLYGNAEKSSSCTFQAHEKR
jgi:hypothetical protein